MKRFWVLPLVVCVAVVAGCFLPYGSDEVADIGPPEVLANEATGETSPRVNIEFEDADIRIVLDLLAKQAGTNLVVDEDVTGRISVALEDVQWLDALEAIVENAGYELVDDCDDEGLYRVVARSLPSAGALESDESAYVPVDLRAEFDGHLDPILAGAGDDWVAQPVPCINLEFRDADIRTALDLLAKQSGANIVVSEGVEGTVTCSLRDVPWREALETVVLDSGYELTETRGPGDTVTIFKVTAGG